MYVPAFSFETCFPPCVSEIEKPGPTVPLSVLPAACTDGAARAAASTASTRNFMTCLRSKGYASPTAYPSERISSLHDRERALHGRRMGIADVLVGPLLQRHRPR